jgi:hypothetical protein
MAVSNFGSGWTWLVKKEDGGVDIVNTCIIFYFSECWMPFDHQ